ncbi:MAG TPA: nuclear transport factor 2 family protein [Mycobacteriales bacterium]|nr:nuclear transport factor 2 family protein [Mycobacteriales bacterium]
MHPDEKLARTAFVAIQNGDSEWLNAHMADDAVLHQGGRFPTAGSYEGKDAVFGHMMEFFAMVDFSMKIAVHDVLATDDHVVGLVQVSIDYQGRHLDFDEAHIWHVRDGMVYEMWAVPKNPYEVDDFFAA